MKIRKWAGVLSASDVLNMPQQQDHSSIFSSVNAGLTPHPSSSSGPTPPPLFVVRKLHLRKVTTRIAELERAVGTFRADQAARRHGVKSTAYLLAEKWARPAAERRGNCPIYPNKCRFAFFSQVHKELKTLSVAFHRSVLCLRLQAVGRMVKPRTPMPAEQTRTVQNSVCQKQQSRRISEASLVAIIHVPELPLGP